jgi:DNA anti-recombination protein RmuC
MQGNWGELLLERVENQVWKKGRDTKCNKTLLPMKETVFSDVVINLPDGKKMISIRDTLIKST